MTTRRSRRTIAAGEFKAQCLAILDQVEHSHEIVVVTKRGRPVARVVPMDEPAAKPLRGSITFLKDIVPPIDVEWEAKL